MDLKTVIPAAIEKARQLGDLRENAEYDAAKARQANAATRLQELISSLERARILETMEIDASRIGVGTEAVLEPVDGGSPITYWILGEGDGGPGDPLLPRAAGPAAPGAPRGRRGRPWRCPTAPGGSGSSRSSSGSRNSATDRDADAAPASRSGASDRIGP